MTRESPATASPFRDPGEADNEPGIGRHDSVPDRSHDEPNAVGPRQAGITPDDPIGHRIAAVESEVAALRWAAAQNDHEIDALQIRATRQERPWYRTLEGLVPVLALVFSLLTAVISGAWAKSQHDAAEQRLRQQAIQEAESQLRVTLQRLTALPKENAVLYEQMSDDAVAGELASFSNMENVMLLDQAVDLIERIPSDRVSATEHATVAWFMNTWAGNHVESERLYQRAIRAGEASNDMMGYLTATRGYAQLLFNMGRIEDGRDHYEKALGVHEKFRNDRPQVAWYERFLDEATELFWANSELSVGNCAEAQRHIQTAGEHLRSIGAVGAAYQPALQVAQQAIDACNPA